MTVAAAATCCQREEMSKVDLCPLNHQSTCEFGACVDVKYVKGKERKKQRKTREES